MSTKTTFKRVALVAVAALGFGVLTSVAPASAAERTPTSITLGTGSPARAGQVTSVSVGASFAAALADNDTMTVAAKVLSAPTGSLTKTATAGVLANTVTGNSPSQTGVLMFTGTASGTTDAVSNTIQTAAVAGISSVAVSAVATRNSTSTTSTTWSGLSLNFTPDVAGTYTILVSAGNTTFTAGNASAVWTITTGGTPTKITVTQLGGQVVTGGTNGVALAVDLTDANGNATILAADEGITVTTTDTTVTLANATFGPGQDDAGTYYTKATANGTVAAGSAVITFRGNGLVSPTVVTNTSVTKVVTTAWPATETAACTTTASCVVTAGASVTAATITVKAAAALTISGLASSATVATNHNVTVTTAAADTYDTYVTVAATTTALTSTATTTFTAPAPSATANSTVTLGRLTLTSTLGAAKEAKISVSGTSSVLSATAGTNKFVAAVVDQYGDAIANVAVSVSVAGRNAAAAKVLGVTDANGLVTFSLTDAGTTGTSDTVTFTASTATATTSAAATITYGTVTVDSVTVSGGSKAETVAGSTLTSIKAGDNGPEGSAVAIKAVVKDASGNLLAGVPVTFTVDAGAIVKTAAIDYATVYTGADGAASTSVFNWISGKQTITATAGGKSSTDYLTWAANDATSARVLTATATGDIVSLKVVDRFGNAVQGVAINLSRTGAGLFGNGASTQDISTDKNGTADVRFIGSGTVVAELAATYAQAYAAAGNITTKAATAAVAGTTKGTGATLAPAGVGKVSVAIAEGADPVAVSSQAAADAAAEATDAANAATDAANAAAEAADAATAAAQDAADAVAALSTQVSEMVDALKKQITALTNLVIKIQKKVRA
jgi:trimeric autotransporter adhesin